MTLTRNVRFSSGAARQCHQRFVAPGRAAACRDKCLSLLHVMQGAMALDMADPPFVVQGTMRTHDAPRPGPRRVVCGHNTRGCMTMYNIIAAQWPWAAECGHRRAC